MSLEKEIKEWDGKSTYYLGSIYNKYSHEKVFIKDIVRLVEQKPLQKGITWLLKKHLENGNKIDAELILTIYKNLPFLEHWEARLHVLQSIPFMPIPISQKKNVEMFLKNCLVNDKKFVRAWAYNSFHELSVLFPEYRKKVKYLFKTAAKKESASVKARIRNIMKKEAK